jgi:hypothetical protein
LNPKFKSHIAYLIFTKNSEYSFFNQYKDNHMQHRNIIGQILKLPKDIAEIYLSKENLINMRMTGIVDGYYIKFVDSIEDIKNEYIKNKFIIVSTAEEVEIIHNNILNIPFILLSTELKTDEKQNLYNFDDLNIDKFQYIFENMLEKQNTDMQTYCNTLKEYTFSRDDSGKTINTDISINQDIYALSNLNTLNSIRVDVDTLNTRKDIKRDMETSINLINKIKAEIFHNLKTYEVEEANYFYDYIISDLSNNLDFQSNNKEYSKYKLKEKYVQEYEIIFEAIKFMKDYKFNETCPKSTNKFIEQYVNEKEYIEQLISIVSASYISPNIKLSLNDIGYSSILKEIGSIGRGDNSDKIHKAFLKLENKFSEDIDDWFDYMDATTLKRLKLVSNLPLEWINHGDLPLMIKNDVSRIPVSP